MFDFIKGVAGAVREGRRAGNIVNLIQKVIGRPLMSYEAQLAKDYYDTMRFSDAVNDHEIVIDYFMFLLAEGEHPSRMERPHLSADAKGRLIEAIRSALGWGVLSLEKGKLSSQPYTGKEEIVSFVETLRRHAGII